jgi:hypothetical protein
MNIDQIMQAAVILEIELTNANEGTRYTNAGRIGLSKLGITIKTI